ncbi:MAG: DUF5020 family protein [Bacteroidaceae bacterium]|nr:DUF5020 family protein [Bacteroidaceae bacterium]
MKKFFALVVLFISAFTVNAQLNVQLHYDLGRPCYGSELSNRPYWTATIENFSTDRWGSTYFFVDANLCDNVMESAYAEISRELKFWKAPFAIHAEYNGGLSGYGSYNDAYLLGGAYNWANSNFSKTFSLQLLYRYLANQQIGSKHSWQVTSVWGIHWGDGLYSFTGYADLSHDNSVNGNLVFSSDPQFWVNLAALKSVPDDMKLSIGTEVKISNNLVWPANGKNNRFYTIPTLAVKWTF